MSSVLSNFTHWGLTWSEYTRFAEVSVVWGMTGSAAEYWDGCNPYAVTIACGNTLNSQFARSWRILQRRIAAAARAEGVTVQRVDSRAISTGSMRTGLAGLRRLPPMDLIRISAACSPIRPLL